MPAASALASSRPIDNPSSDGGTLLFPQARPEFLNVLNHPLQLQLATGDLQLGAFQRLILDRAAMFEGLGVATASLPEIKGELLECNHKEEALTWLEAAQQAGKTIVLPDIQCYNCGGDHLNIQLSRGSSR